MATSIHPFVQQVKLDRLRGCLMGAALGDCIGLYTEFLSGELAVKAYGASPSFSLLPSSVTPFRSDSHRDRFALRAWTDDTDHTILLLLSYLSTGPDLQPKDLALRLKTWISQGLIQLDRLPLGLGKTVGSVVLTREFLDTPHEVAKSKWESSGRHIAPNGSLMRTAPVGCVGVGKTLEETFEDAILMGGITHADPRCHVACCISSGLVRGLILGNVASVADVDTMVEKAYKYITEIKEMELDREEFEKHAYAKSFVDLQLDDSQKMGYVYKCMGTALGALRTMIGGSSFSTRMKSGKSDFRNLITWITMHGGDADTNATAAGALLGAYCGYVALPYEWRDGMMHREWYMLKVDDCAASLGLISDERYTFGHDVDTRFDGGKGLRSDEELQKREMRLMEDMLLKMGVRKKEEEERLKKEKKNKGSGIFSWGGNSSSKGP